jgi:hypothetical protein
MPSAKPAAGGRYRYTGTELYGDLAPDELVTVREVVPADEPGAHDNSEDAVVVEWEVPSRVRTENGWGHGVVPRALSVGVSTFGDLFTKEA